MRLSHIAVMSVFLSLMGCRTVDGSAVSEALQDLPLLTKAQSATLNAALNEAAHKYPGAGLSPQLEEMLPTGGLNPCVTMAINMALQEAFTSQEDLSLTNATFDDRSRILGPEHGEGDSVYEVLMSFNSKNDKALYVLSMSGHVAEGQCQDVALMDWERRP